MRQNQFNSVEAPTVSYSWQGHEPSIRHNLRAPPGARIVVVLVSTVQQGRCSDVWEELLVPKVRACETLCEFT